MRGCESNTGSVTETMADANSIKTALRRNLLADRQSIAEEVRRDRDRIIADRVVAWWKQHRPACLAVYIPMRGEPDLNAAYGELHGLGAGLALPVVTNKAMPLSFAEWTPGETLTRDMVGVPVPASGKLVQPQALLIPCVGFNSAGFRLGYGGGFYDRTLATAPRPLAIGVAYASAQTSFEVSPHDIAMDLIITD